MASDEKFIYLVEIEAYDPDLPGTTTLRYTSGEGKTTLPSETPPNVYYENRVTNPINFTRTAFSDSRVMGGGEIGFGEIVLSNLDQEMSFLLDYGLDGRQVVVRTGRQDGAYPADFAVLFTGTMKAPTVSTSEVRINLKDKLALLDVPFQTNRYAGTNAAGSGKEGTADDIIGKVKPRLLGKCFEVSPVMVNTSKLIYQINDGSMTEVVTVKDKGLALPFGTDRANLAAMEATAPAAGDYDTCLAEGLIRLGAPAEGKLTVTARGDNTGGYINTIGDIASRAMTSYAGIASATISSTSVASLNSAAPYEVGIFVDSERTVQDVLDDLLSGVGAWVAPDRDGDWVFGQLVAPSGTPLLTFTDYEILSLELQTSSDENKSVPIYRAIVKYGKRWTQFSDTDLAATVSDADKAILTNEWRSSVATDATIQTKHLLAPELTRESLLNNTANADTEAARILALHKVRRDLVNVEVRLDEENTLLDIGSVVELETSRLGYSAGKLFYVVGITSDGARNKLMLQLWG